MRIYFHYRRRYTDVSESASYCHPDFASNRQGLSKPPLPESETRSCYPAGMVRSIGIRAKEETVAHNLYAVLREFDDLGADVIYSESFPGDQIGQAIMNRLTKAAGHHIIHVM